MKDRDGPKEPPPARADARLPLTLSFPFPFASLPLKCVKLTRKNNNARKKLARARPWPPLARPSLTGTALQRPIPRITARARCQAWPLPAGPHLGPQAGSVRKNGSPFSAPPHLAPTLLTEECTCSSLSAFRSPLNAFTNSGQLGKIELLLERSAMHYYIGTPLWFVYTSLKNSKGCAVLTISCWINAERKPSQRSG